MSPMQRKDISGNDFRQFTNHQISVPADFDSSYQSARDREELIRQRIEIAKHYGAFSGGFGFSQVPGIVDSQRSMVEQRKGKRYIIHPLTFETVVVEVPVDEPEEIGNIRRKNAANFFRYTAKQEAIALKLIEQMTPKPVQGIKDKSIDEVIDI